MPPVRAGDAVPLAEHAREPDGDGLLPGVQVRRAVDLTAEEEALDAILEAPDEQHPAVELRGEAERRRQRSAGLFPWSPRLRRP